MSDDPILAQLAEIERLYRQTGRKQHKKLAGLQAQMLLDAQEMTKRALKTCDKLLKQRDDLIQVNRILGDTNNDLYWTVHELIGMREYSA